MKGRIWTSREVDALRRYWPTHTTGEIAEALGRSVSAVQTKVCVLRKAGCALPYRHFWTEEQIETLRVHWDLEPRYNTAHRVGRTVHACEIQVGLMFGSMLRRKWEPEDRERE